MKEWESWLKSQHSKNKNHGTQSYHSMVNRWGNNGNSDRLLFSWAQKSLQMVSAAMKLKYTCSLEKKFDKPQQHIKKQTLLCQQRSIQSNLWCFWTVVLEKTLESLELSRSLSWKIKPVSIKGNRSWIFIGRTDAKAPVLWPPDTVSQFIGKDLNAEKDWRQEEKGTTVNKMAGWHHQLNGHEFEQALGDSEGPRSLACCSPWGHKESDTTEWLNNSEGYHQAGSYVISVLSPWVFE